ncbi:EXS family-domain-containing protein [Diplogelasinospora grovesii]|uniref:EXS family-domain-containing protein n=1 Tax=Diplogelasinospora grovesii TaxID=303347 RepID=A0AAN6NHF1_9PEZI|nr:EXS family-domain-containing protein [Diplogelasinospora grovesii]
MKFAKELEREAVPEWREKYLNYKAGKKHIKAVIRAINRATATPSLGKHLDLPPHHTPSNFFNQTWTITPTRRTDVSTTNAADETSHPLRTSSSPIWRDPAQSPSPKTVPRNERAGLAKSPGGGLQYGSFLTPASRTTQVSRHTDKHDFELPAPAMRVPSKTSDWAADPDPLLSRVAVQRSASMAAAVSGGQQAPNSPPPNLPPGGASSTPRSRLYRIFSTGSPLTRQTSNKLEIRMQSLDQVREAERAFFAFLDSELDKIETFYRMKEDQASKRLAALREQLHEMRNRRIEEIAEMKRKREQEPHNGPRGNGAEDHGNSRGLGWIDPIKSTLFKPGPNSKALQKMTRTPVMNPQSIDEGRDYVRRAPAQDGVPYRTAKRKLKLALQEFYRGLELLKSYAILNRTAFRKLNKKYDKAVNARPPYRYMNEKVNKSWFVNSDVLDGHIRTVEDLYARYFERGNHKIAAGKLRNLNKRPGDASGTSFRSGLLIGIGAVFAVQGLVFGSELLFSDDPVLSTQTSYLMQLYGGYFLMLFLFSLFCLDCKVWTANKVNYPFIFEFDPRNHLEWKHLAEFPSFFFALLGIIMWLNFTRYGYWQPMYLYYPVILISLTALVLFFPAPVFHHKARRWFIYSHYRLFFAGLYPVEFRDFFLGDIWCSLTYSTCNIELFFCLYAHYWNDPEQCNSTHSRLLGFFNALPPIWRALQCIRRYNDTGNVFPHLVNCGKYSMTIITAVFLSLYRIDDSHTNLAFFITFAAINAVYCAIWDVFMDFSLLQSHARHPLLRDVTALKSVWPYYVAMVVDPILRFSWVGYAIFTHNTQHSTIVSFIVSLIEVTRRGIWTIFRVENEHCANVAEYKASRDTPLPYDLEPLVEPSSLDVSAKDIEENADGRVPPTPAASSARTTGLQIPGSGRTGLTGGPSATEGTPSSMPEGSRPESAGASTFRRRSSVAPARKRSIFKVMAEAHKQDFEKRRPSVLEAAIKTADPDEDDDEELPSEEEDEDEDEENESGSMHEERMRVREAESLMRRGQSGSEAEDGEDGPYL